MKKTTKPDIIELVNKIQQQLNVLETKIDTLINKPPQRPVETKTFTKPFQQPSAHTHSQGSGMQNGNYRERVLHKAICADCKKECEVPFKPSGERPVYCKECFSKRKTVSSFKTRPDNKPASIASSSHIPQIAKPQVIEKKKSAGKKKPVTKKRKAH